MNNSGTQNSENTASSMGLMNSEQSLDDTGGQTVKRNVKRRRRSEGGRQNASGGNDPKGAAKNASGENVSKGAAKNASGGNDPKGTAKNASGENAPNGAAKKTGKKQSAEKIEKKAANSGKANKKAPQAKNSGKVEPDSNLFEISNSDLPPGIPPVKPFVNTRRRRNGSKANGVSSVEGGKKDGSKGGAVESELKSDSAFIEDIKPKKVQSAAYYVGADQIRDQIVEALKEKGVPMAREALVQACSASQAETESALLTMLEKGELFLTRKRKFALPQQMGYVSGKLQTTTRGFGFLLPDDSSEDIFIPQHNLNGALNGDTVVVRMQESHGSSREGDIVAVRSRANDHIVGTLQKENGAYYLVPDNSRLGTEFSVEKSKLAISTEGQKVVASVIYADSEISLRVEEALGFPGDSGTDVKSILRAHNIPEEFPRHVINQAKNVDQTVSEDDILRREDLRNLQTVTIDGADSKDFDDAVSCEELLNGNFLLGVHIADVCNYVKENSALDKEALRRGTSVYFVDRVVPMLPQELSNGICSLNPQVNRLALSCFMEIDSRGRVLSHRIAETVICSKARMVYEDITRLLEGDNEQLKKYEQFVPMLQNMEKLAGILRKNRFKRGSIDFDLPESKISVDEHGRPMDIRNTERGISNKIIEEFMIACNETIAEYMYHLERPMMYRVHEAPDREKISELNIFLGSLGLALRNVQSNIRAKSLQMVLDKAKGKPAEGVISRVILRSLKKAKYSEENLGHFGLASEYYCHFTSPIRRYPDLQVHRVLKEMLKGQLSDKRVKHYKSKMPEIAQQCSERERTAIEAERDIEDLKKCEYLADHIDEVFTGVISGVTNFGLFVELPNTCEGMICMRDLTDDYYEFDAKSYRLIGRHMHKVFRLGDKITIRISSVDMVSRRAEFKLEQESPPKGRRPRRAKAK